MSGGLVSILKEVIILQSIARTGGRVPSRINPGIQPISEVSLVR